MTSSPDSGNTAGRDEKRWHGAGITLAGVAVVFVLGAPGFLAAGFSQGGPYGAQRWGVFCLNNELYWDHSYGPNPPLRFQAEMIVLAPSGWLMKRSPAVRRLYNWEYHFARGVSY